MHVTPATVLEELLRYRRSSQAETPSPVLELTRPVEAAPIQVPDQPEPTTLLRMACLAQLDQLARSNSHPSRSISFEIESYRALGAASVAAAQYRTAPGSQRPSAGT